MSVVDVAKAFNDLKCSASCQRVTMEYTGVPRTTQLFKFYIVGREQPIEVSFVGDTTPAELATAASKQL